MMYRRRQGGSGPSSFKEETDRSRIRASSPENSSSSSAPSLAAKAIRASSAYRDSSLSSAYGHSSPSSSFPNATVARSSISVHQESTTTPGYTSIKNLNEAKQSKNEPRQSFWGALARKAKNLVEDDNAAQQFEAAGRTRLTSDNTSKFQPGDTYQSSEDSQKMENPRLQRGLDALASSLSYIGGTIGNALEEGMTVVENRTADIIQETRKLQIRKKVVNNSSEKQNQSPAPSITQKQQPPMQQQAYNMQPQPQNDLEIQLKASRDVAMAMAAKAKLLLRELKTVKADLAFAKERCGQLEEENRIVRESLQRGGNPEDDDLIRLQLETLLAEKARLAQENSVFARENRFLREIVEYHQLTMQDVVYLDENKERVTEVYPIKNVYPIEMPEDDSPPPSDELIRDIAALNDDDDDVNTSFIISSSLQRCSKPK
ncbi:uncharacterized protein LOC124916549 [Impatiens glandulifera]|uniref:uncharacterized protein LOC124916549 n=1 Tax=Impatiens glandulifera TaxID=253017 RepID=UPI001FB11923|nr:uncharacterized protein LOC124916549 [Impatiens glandulifera]